MDVKASSDSCFVDRGGRVYGTNGASKDAIWLQGLMKELGMNMVPMTLLCDSMSAIYLAKNLVYHKNTKHIDVQHHYIRKVTKNDKIRALKVGTHENTADMLTKLVQVEKLK